MLRFTITNNSSTGLTQDELMDLFCENLGVPLDKKNGGLIRISPRSNENSFAITIGKNRGIKRDLFLSADLTSVRKASITFSDATPVPLRTDPSDEDIDESTEEDDTEPVNNDENVVVDREGNPV